MAPGGCCVRSQTRAPDRYARRVLLLYFKGNSIYCRATMADKAIKRQMKHLTIRDIVGS